VKPSATPEDGKASPQTRKRKDPKPADSTSPGPFRSSSRVKSAPERFKEPSVEAKESNGEIGTRHKRKSEVTKNVPSKKKKGAHAAKKRGSEKKPTEKKLAEKKKPAEKKSEEPPKKRQPKPKVKAVEVVAKKAKAKSKPKKSKKAKEDSNDDPAKLYCCDEKYNDSKEYIGCSKEKACKGYEWYHVECVGLTHTQVTRLGDWFCDACKKADAEAAAADQETRTGPSAEARSDDDQTHEPEEDDEEGEEGDLPDDEENVW